MAKLVFDDKDRIAFWVAEKTGQTCSWGGFYAMGAEVDGSIVAGVVFNNFNGHNVSAHIAIDRPGKYLPYLLYHAFRYAFLHCRLGRLTGMVDCSDKKVLAFDRHLGFEDEFVMKGAGSDGGDLQVLVMWADKCRWLSGRYANPEAFCENV